MRLLALLLAAGAAAQAPFPVLPSQCPDAAGSFPRLIEATNPMTRGAQFTVIVTAPPGTGVFVVVGQQGALGLPCDLSSLGFAPWTTSCQVWAVDTVVATATTFSSFAAFPTWTIPSDQMLSGLTLWLQAYAGCPECPFGVAPSNGLQVTVQ